MTTPSSPVIVIAAIAGALVARLIVRTWLSRMPPFGRLAKFDFSLTPLIPETLYGVDFARSADRRSIRQMMGRQASSMSGFRRLMIPKSFRRN
jgi:hypothetical protein